MPLPKLHFQTFQLYLQNNNTISTSCQSEIQPGPTTKLYLGHLVRSSTELYRFSFSQLPPTILPHHCPKKRLPLSIYLTNKLHFADHSNKLSINTTKVSNHLQLFHNIWLLQRLPISSIMWPFTADPHHELPFTSSHP